MESNKSERPSSAREWLLGLRNGPLLYILKDFCTTTAHCLETCLTSLQVIDIYWM